MKLLVPDYNASYHLLDSGHGLKLEQFGPNRIIRPDISCVWAPKLSAAEWNKADAVYNSNGWESKKSFAEPWIMTYQIQGGSDIGISKLTFALKFSPTSKNIGIFPEQAANWAWIVKTIQESTIKPNVLNLFGYTGAATLAAAAAGAEVCHVDASKAAITWARHNQELSHMNDAPIRWIVDDCATFIAREIKRGVKYHALIIDPPAFGRDQKGKVFEFEKKIYELMLLCKEVLVEKPVFVLFNGYAMGYSATVLDTLLKEIFPTENVECGELQIKHHKRDYNLPCSLFARFNQK